MEKIEYRGRRNVVGVKLREHRQRCGMKQSELAAKLQLHEIQIDQQMVSKIENDKRIVTDYELACMCKIFEISPTELLEDFFSELGADG